MKVSVATIDRGDRQPSPNTSWPLVQPPLMHVPRPTRNPLVVISHKGALESAGTGWPITLGPTEAPASEPSKNNQRQSLSGPAGEPQAMRLMPATRCRDSSSHIAEGPNNTPPVSGIRHAHQCHILDYASSAASK